MLRNLFVIVCRNILTELKKGYISVCFSAGSLLVGQLKEHLLFCHAEKHLVQNNFAFMLHPMQWAALAESPSIEKWPVTLLGFSSDIRSVL